MLNQSISSSANLYDCMTVQSSNDLCLIPSLKWKTATTEGKCFGSLPQVLLKYCESSLYIKALT